MPATRASRSATSKRNATSSGSPLRLDLACGQNKQEGFTGVDIAGDTDVRHDLLTFPWPFKTSSVDETFSSHFAEHIPHHRSGWDRDGWWLFFDELHRVLKPGGKAVFVHPYVKSDRAFWDPTHVRFIHEQTWYYLDAGWRAAQRLDHYPVAADFEVVTIQLSGLDGEYVNRPEAHQVWARQRFWNVAGDLIVELKARKP